MTARIVLADHSGPARIGLRLALQRGGLEVTGEAGDVDDLLALAELTSADMVVMAADLPGGGLCATREIAGRHPRVRLVVLTDAQSGDEMVAAILAGASGYLARDVAADRLPTVVRAMLDGEAALPRGLSGRLVDELRIRARRRDALPARARADLSPREWDVLEQLSENRRTSEIGDRLGIADVTVRRHISSLIAKLHLRDRAELVKLLRGRD